MSSHFSIKNDFLENRLINNRLIFSAIFACLLFAIIMIRLVMLQLVEYEHFNALSEQNRVDIRALPPQRGRIYDRNGIVLAENISTFDLELTPENVPDLAATLDRLAELVSISSDELLDIKKTIKGQRRFKSVTLKQRLTQQEVATFSVNQHTYPGVEVVGRLVRSYPQGALFAHSVGYVGRINTREQNRINKINKQNYQGTHQIGKTGVEREYEDLLHGTVGYQQVETNVQGRIVRELFDVPPIAGKDLFLNIDVNLQGIAATALGEFNGAVVVLDPKTSGVLAMVSKPDFDPNLFVSGISTKEYALLRDSIDRPLFDRTLKGYYPPGSTLKPFVALAGLELGVVHEHTKSFCPGWFRLPGQDHKYRCWKEHGHGQVDLNEALYQSCDVYFYDLANALGIDRLHRSLDLFGFGHKTGIDLPGESKGLSPSKEWKRSARKQAWYPGETVISGIGQGFNQMTPIQLAHATAILAMRGVNISPQIARATRDNAHSAVTLIAPKKTEILPMENSQHWETVIDSMVEVVHGDRGTARHIGKNISFKIAGKTGTAQVFGIKQDERYDAETLEKRLHDHALFIAFAPADKPEIVMAIVVENGGGGSAVATPIARSIIDQYFGITNND